MNRSYNLEGLAAYLSARPPAYRTHPRMFDTECLHTPYLPPPTNNTSAGHRSPALKPHRHAVPEADLLNLDNPSNPKPERRKTGFSKTPGGRSRQPSNGGGGEETDDDEHDEEWVPDVFLFEYGTVVIWGMTEREEKRFLGSLQVPLLIGIRKC
jgi:uncharacterized Rmd1/YagE family protein